MELHVTKHDLKFAEILKLWIHGQENSRVVIWPRIFGRWLDEEKPTKRPTGWNADRARMDLTSRDSEPSVATGLVLNCTLKGLHPACLTDTSTVSNIHTAVDASESTLGFGAFQRNTLACRLSTFQVDDHKFVDTTRVWRIYYFGVSECLPGSFRLVKNLTGAPRGWDSYIQLAGERSLGQARATIPLWGCIRKGIQRKSAKSNHLLWNLLWQRISRTSFKLLSLTENTERSRNK